MSAVQRILVGFLCLSFNSCSTEVETAPKILDVKNSPSSPSDRGLHAFFDLGSWMGYALNEDTASTGFSGPYILGVDHGVWAANEIAEFDLESEDHNLSNLISYNSEYLPGELRNTLVYETAAINSTLQFKSDRTAIVSTQIENKANEDLCFTPLWKGEVFEGGLAKSNISIQVNLPSNQKIFIHPQEEGELVLESDSSYHYALQNTCLSPSEVQTFSIEIQYHPDHKTYVKSDRTRDDDRWGEYLQITSNSSLSEDEKIVLTKSVYTLINNWRSPAGELKHDGLFPSYHYKWFHGFWSWDSWKHAVALCEIDSELAKNQIRAMYDFQDENGMIADCVFRDTTVEKHNWRDTKPPLSGWAIWEVYNETKDIKFLEELYPKLVNYHLWWYEFRDYDNDGLCEYGSTDGTLKAAKWESGMDNAIRFDSCHIVEGSNFSLNTESVDLNSYLASEKIYLAKMCIELELDNSRWLNEFHDLCKSVREDFYDTETGYFYDIDAETGEFLNSAMGPEGWTPLWCGVASTEQAESVVSHMMDTSKFNTFIPLPTIDVSHPKFDPQDGYWRGPVWLDQAWFGVDGLRRYGYDSEADLLKQKVIENCEGLTTPGVPIRENYHPLTGDGLNAEHFSWSAASLILLLSE